ncbi:MAG: hypothetical protein KGM43_05520 [Planctomycetota bacterium]|nr:hypothetical protein [Planctomycetota bacterium]
MHPGNVVTRGALLILASFACVPQAARGAAPTAFGSFVDEYFRSRYLARPS